MDQFSPSGKHLWCKACDKPYSETWRKAHENDRWVHRRINMQKRMYLDRAIGHIRNSQARLAAGLPVTHPKLPEIERYVPLWKKGGKITPQELAESWFVSVMKNIVRTEVMVMYHDSIPETQQGDI